MVYKNNSSKKMHILEAQKVLRKYRAIAAMYCLLFTIFSASVAWALLYTLVLDVTFLFEIPEFEQLFLFFLYLTFKMCVITSLGSYLNVNATFYTTIYYDPPKNKNEIIYVRVPAKFLC